MRDCSTALANYLANHANVQIYQADLYTFRLVDGSTYRWTGGLAPIVVPSAGFPAESINAGADRSFALGPGFGRSKVSTKIGVEPTELDIEIYPTDSDRIGIFPFQRAAQQRLFDGATVELDRFFAPPPTSNPTVIDTSLGCMVWFYGRVADVTIGRSKIAVKVKSLLNLLQVQQSPPRLFEAACGFVFGGARCGFNRTTGANALGTLTGIAEITVTADSGSTTTTVELTAPMGLDYRLGTATGVTGLNAGIVRTVTDNGTGQQMIVARDFPFAPLAGDTFTVLPGCDHTLGGAQGCTGRQNKLRFGGMPYIPPPEVAV